MRLRVSIFVLFTLLSECFPKRPTISFTSNSTTNHSESINLYRVPAKQINTELILPENQYTDSDLGITEFATSHKKGIGGIFKWFWSDFRVHELAPWGAPVVLNDTNTIPSKPWPQSDIEDDAWLGVEELMGYAHTSRIRNFLRQHIRQHSGRSPLLVLDAGNASTKVAEVINSSGLHLNATATVLGTLMIAYNTKPALSDQAEQAENINASLHFVVAKAGWDTMTLARSMARWLGCDSSGLKFAGVKDKASVSEQRFSAQGISPRRLLRLNGDRRLGGLRLGNLAYCDRPIAMGGLGGNRFTVLLRHLSVEPRAARRAARGLRRTGFVNYFGHQRFGDGGVSGLPPVEAGRALLRGHYVAVINMATDPARAVCPREREAKRDWAAGRRGEALRRLPRSCADERAAMEAVMRGADARDACWAMPHRTLFMCAYWSRLWNRAVSARLRLRGPRPCPGDLVRDPAAARPAGGGEDGLVAGGEDGLVAGGEDGLVAGVRRLTAEEAASGRFHMWDVLLPIPSKGVTMVWPGPGTGAAESLREALEADGLLDAVCNPRWEVGPAVLRPVVLRPSRLACRAFRYGGPADVVSAAAVRGRKGAEGRVAFFGGASGAQRRWAALQLRFDLPPNAYASMLLRELTRGDLRMTGQYNARRIAEMEELAHETRKLPFNDSLFAAEGNSEIARDEDGGHEKEGDGDKMAAEDGPCDTEAWQKLRAKLKRRGYAPDWRLRLAEATALSRRRPGSRELPRPSLKVAALVREASIN